MEKKQVVDAYNERCSKLDAAVTALAYLISLEPGFVPCELLCKGFSKAGNEGLLCPYEGSADVRECANAIIVSLTEDITLRAGLEKEVRRATRERKERRTASL